MQNPKVDEAPVVRFTMPTSEVPKVPKPPKVFDPTAPYFRTPGVAWFCGVSSGRVRQWRVDGTGPVFHMRNGRAIYSRADLEAFMAAAPRYRSTSERSAAEQRAA